MSRHHRLDSRIRTIQVSLRSALTTLESSDVHHEAVNRARARAADLLEGLRPALDQYGEEHPTRRAFEEALAETEEKGLLAPLADAVEAVEEVVEAVEGAVQDLLEPPVEPAPESSPGN